MIISFGLKSQGTFPQITIPVDKQLHFAAGASITTLSYYFSKYAYKNRNKALLIGFTCGVLAGVGKELYDKYSGMGTPSVNDALATAAGSACATITLRIFRIENKEKRKLEESKKILD